MRSDSNVTISYMYFVKVEITKEKKKNEKKTNCNMYTREIIVTSMRAKKPLSFSVSSKTSIDMYICVFTYVYTYIHMYTYIGACFSYRSSEFP